MRSRDVFGVTAILALALPGGWGLGDAGRAAAQDADPRGTELRAAAQAFVKLLAEEKFDAATKDFDDTMKKVMPAKKLEETWKSVVSSAGPFQKQTGTRAEQIGKYDVVYVTCKFAKVPVDTKVVFNKDKQITGLFFAPPKKAGEDYRAPDYVRRDAFQETEVKIGTGEWVLPGTLSVPKGEGSFPAVVLVHGSGPHDRDESIGPNLPFRDLAWGLASRGVAVLRYEKRTREHATKWTSSNTVKEEVLDDALAAVALLRRQKGVDGKRVFLLGHSLGAVLCPKIGTLDPKIAGLICLAGSTRSIEVVMTDQLNYLLSLDPNLDANAKERLEKLKAQAAKLADPKFSKDTPAGELPFGVGFVYWQSLRDNDPVKVVAQVKQPMLILQGERDFQVRMADFEGWKKALAGRKDVTFKSYPKLNHLFMAGEGKSKPEEYGKAGHIPGEVIEDIAGWIKRH